MTFRFRRRIERQALTVRLSEHRTAGPDLIAPKGFSFDDAVGWMNNRADNSHLPFRRGERAMLRFRRMRTLQKFVAVHASVYNLFNTERSLSSRHLFKANRAAALAEWRGLCAG